MSLEVATLNGRPAPYRRDLRGDDLAYEMGLLLGKLQPGDLLRISCRALILLGSGIGSVDLARVHYKYERWYDQSTDEVCIRRLA